MHRRLPALDWMRGLVMVVMASDHASGAFNRDRPMTDSALLPQIDLVPVEFLYRWVSHLCAPTFVFLAGASLALSIERKVARGERSAAIDRDLLVRGLLVLAVDLLVIHWLWLPGGVLLQVMFAIGASMILMIPARRLPATALLAIAAVVLVVAEPLLPATVQVPPGTGPAVRTLALGIGMVDTPLERLGVLDRFFVAYPVLPWWAMMAAGWAFGRFLVARRDEPTIEARAARLLAWGGAAGLASFAIVRGANGFGNLRLTRLDDSWVQWLHVSKYPPSLAFVALELGLMATILAGLFLLQRRAGDAVSADGPILVFGQTAFFFYVAHILALEAAARVLGLHQARGLGTSLIAAAVVLVALYPICRAYRALKARHPRSLLRFF